MVTKEHGKDSQLQRFVDAAKKTGANESLDALDKIMGRLDLSKKPEPVLKQNEKK